MRENPHVLNPAQGYVASANQVTTDSTYPYNYTNSGWVNLRAWRINHLLSGMQKASVADMQAMQNDTYSELAAKIAPIFLMYTHTNSRYVDELKKWDYHLNADSKAATFFQVWWSYFYEIYWSSVELSHVPNALKPLQEITILLSMDEVHYSGYSEHLVANVEWSCKKALDSMGRLEKSASSDWYKVKNTSVTDLAKLAAFSYDHMKIGGWGNTINAAKGDHGPSWRMIVQMGKEIEAYGVYPGGQSGNPGSKYYADYLQHWVEGKYYKLDFLPNSDKQDDKAIKYTLAIHN